MSVSRHDSSPALSLKSALAARHSPCESGETGITNGPVVGAAGPLSRKPRTMVVGGESLEYWTTKVGELDWVANTETRTGCGESEAAAVQDLYELLDSDVVRPWNLALGSK